MFTFDLAFIENKLDKNSCAMKTNWKDYITSTPEVLKGKPRIINTRIPVSLILGYLASGKQNDEILKEFDDLKPEHITACLDYARELSEFEVAA